MKCETVKKKIDQLIFEESSTLIEEVRKHLEICEQCEAYHQRCNEMRKVTSMLQKSPILADPEKLTEDILLAIENADQNPAINQLYSSEKVIRLITKALAAASVILVIVFGIEQYQVVNSVSKLETYSSAVSTENPYVSLKKLVIYNAGTNISGETKIDEITFLNQKKISTQIMQARISSIITDRENDENINRLLAATGSFYRINMKNSH